MNKPDANCFDRNICFERSTETLIKEALRNADTIQAEYIQNVIKKVYFEGFCDGMHYLAWIKEQ